MPEAQGEPFDIAFETLILYIQESRGFDFRGYKRTSLRWRIGLRMEALGLEDFAAYHAFLEAHPQEFNELLNTVLINVTSFFRDSEAWAVLKSDIVPRLIAPEPGNGQLRIWSVGCATGEEAYSLAMLFAQALGPAEYARRIKIYATDLDEAALNAARRGSYNAREIEGVPADLLQRYFDRAANGQWVVNRDLRKSLIFGRHNVVADAPISRINLLVCRNLLIYLENETQNIVLPRLHFALVDSGVLFLGKSETQLARSKLFQPLNMKCRLFEKVRQEWRRLPGGGVVLGGDMQNDLPPLQARVLDAIVDTGTSGYLAVNAEGYLVFANLPARRLLGLAEDDVGRPFQDLPISYRPIELRGPIEDAMNQGRLVRIEHQEFHRPPDDTIRLSIEVVPLVGRDGKPFAALIKFTDSTRVYMLQQEVEAAQTSLENTIEELQSANEELETTNEELQATNEELETTNEELQSTNEELETTNEEHRSTNEELEATIEELRRQSELSNRYQRYADALIASIDAGIIVLDNDFLVQAWNRWNENVWGMRADEAMGRGFLDLDIGLPVERLRNDLHRAVANGNAVDRSITGMDRRGRTVICNVRIAPLRLTDGSAQGLMLIITDRTQAEQDAAHAHYLGRVVGKALNEVYFLDPETLRFTLINHGVERSLGYGMAQLRTMTLADVMPGVSIERLRALIQPLLDGERQEIVFDTMLRARGGEEHSTQICLQFFKDEDPPLLLAVAHKYLAAAKAGSVMTGGPSLTLRERVGKGRYRIVRAGQEPLHSDPSPRPWSASQPKPARGGGVVLIASWHIARRCTEPVHEG